MSFYNACLTGLIALLIVGCTQSPNPITDQESNLPNINRPDAMAKDNSAVHVTSAPMPAPSPAPISADRSASYYYAQRPVPPAFYEYENRENYEHLDNNPVKLVANDPVSTFSIDVDTGSYSNVRRILNEGRMPPQGAVRIEEMINYFNYQYPQPKGRQPFSIVTEMAPSPWNNDTQLLHVGIQGVEFSAKERPDANLVFLVDVSGSMNQPNKLGLLKSSLKLLVKNMRDEDRIAIAVYAGAAGTVLESTPGKDRRKIISALDKLHAGGSTNGAAGIKLAYQIASENYIAGGINRIMLATDGDFNVGTTNFEQLIEMVERERKNGVSLTTLGFGAGNYNDHLSEQLADAGNGNHAYIDNLREANKVLVEQMGATLQTIAKDVKIQLEFNPAHVSQYRLIGYENRMLKREDFNNDKIDAGEIGAGHTVTALYEIVLADSDGGWVEPLKYQQNKPAEDANLSGELAELRIRYKQPEGNNSELILQPLDRKAIIADLEDSSENFRFAAAVAGFGQVLRGADMLNDFNYEHVLELARAARSDDQHGYRGEFVSLVSLASSIDQN